MNEKLAAIIVHDIKNTLGMLESELREMTQAYAREDTSATQDQALIDAGAVYAADAFNAADGADAAASDVALADTVAAIVRLPTETTASLRERAAHAHATCLSLQDRLVGFLTLYKASSQGLTPHIEPLAPDEFLGALLAQLRTGKMAITLEIDPAGMPPVAFFDENLIALALEAALQNALRFARARITLGCVQRDGYLCFTVADDGPGLGVKEKTASTGLGMELCSAIAVAHVRNERTGAALLGNRPEGGALFELRLP